MSSGIEKLDRASIKGDRANDSLTTRLIEIPNAKDAQRQRFGRTISMDRLENAIVSATRGVMRDLTDISRETIDMDPHLGSVLNKRFGAVAALPWELYARTGQDIDKKRALDCAALVREQLRNLSQFRLTLGRLAWAKFDGRAAFELHWRVGAGGRFTLVDIEWIHPRRLNFGPHRELRVWDETDRASGVFPDSGIPLDINRLRRAGCYRKFLWWTPSLFGEYPEREGLAPRCVYWSFFKRYSQRDRMILLELFGRPWRIIEVDEESTISGDELAKVDTIVDALGSTYTARMPRGARLNVIQPGQTAGQVHREVIEDSDHQISKLVLGQTGTTDGAPAGFNSNQASIMRDEQLGILIKDALDIQEVVQQHLINAILEVNLGAEALSYAPRFVLRADLPADRNIEIQRLTGALNAGLSVSLDEAYEVSGFRRPESDEVVVKIDQPPASPLSPNLPAPRPVIVYPGGGSPDAGEQQPPAPTAAEGEGAREENAGAVSAPDAAKVVTVNEARAQQGLPPLTKPDGTPDPEGDLTVVDFEERKKQRVAVEAVEAARYIRPRPLVCAFRGTTFSIGAHENNLARDLKQPSSARGNPEDIIGRGATRGAGELDQWVSEFEVALDGVDNATQIERRMEDVREELEVEKFAETLEEALLHSAALGAYDVFDAVQLARGDEDFSKQRFPEVADEFLQKDILTKEQWQALTGAARRRAFTIARIQSEALLELFRDELEKQLRSGADLGRFVSAIRKRAESAGFIFAREELLTPSHMETVFRTNVMDGYNSGRHRRMQQPEMVDAFPGRRIVAVIDERTRVTHAAANDRVLSATDGFWTRAYPPFGFNCRCRVAPESDRNRIVPGSTISGLPDPGFASGVAVLL
jgi:SPP1 gp7 family putative phage head morphogenesis protein